uniref:Nose resistant to fluoxetine protein 6-like n=1 Tax=Saccoglossus kowalevskii TaxID=10224 RepID=A0ABM0MTF7_SACKO|nr:PREDICTED: nose resistant to fluoxetine protein 6-like [Saccoglossus kowalevskii]
MAVLSVATLLCLALSCQFFPVNCVIPLSSLIRIHNGLAEHVLTNSSSDPVSEQCLHALGDLFNDTTKLIPIVDSLGKVGAGILDGNTAWLGSFELCRNMTAMQYCYTQLYAVIPMGKKNTILPIEWGLCIVDECSSQDVANGMQLFINATLGFGKLIVDRGSVFCAQDPPKPYSAGFYFTVFLCCLLATLMLIGWCVDIFLRISARIKAGQPLITKTEVYNEDSNDDYTRLQDTPVVHFAALSQDTNFIQEFFLCFAFNRNIARVLDTSQPEKAIRCLHGLRVINNLATGSKVAQELTFQAISNAFFSVDTFFFLRLTPTVAMAILVWMFILPWVGQGPMWFKMLPKPYCEKYWWSTLLYINNFYPDSLTEECLGWTWYLSNDWQFYVISPIILIPLYRSRKVGFIILSCILTASFIVTGTLIGVYDLNIIALGDTPDSLETGPNFTNSVYIKPYCRIAPYLVGMAMGYVLQRLRSKKLKVTVSPMVAAIGWCLATIVALSCVYGLYSTAHGHVLSTAENVIYGTFSRFAWSLTLSWVVFACRYGIGGAVEDFLSHSFWIPLSRLTFCAYLLHPMILDILVFAFATPLHFTINILSFHFVGVTVMSYGAALLLSMSVEYPCGNLEKLLERHLTCCRGKTQDTGSIQN